MLDYDVFTCGGLDSFQDRDRLRGGNSAIIPELARSGIDTDNSYRTDFPPSERKHVLIILQKDYGLPRHLESQSLMFLRTNNFRRYLGVGIGFAGVE